MRETHQLSPDTVIISSNENPLGPAQCALTAICNTATLGGRYHFDEYVKTVGVFNESFGLKKDYSALFPGSGGPLDLALMSNIGPDKPLVYGDPSYEQGPRAADTMKATKYPVPLTATYAHDVKAMLKAHPSPGAYYIVNPNNPTGTMTPKEDIVWLVNNKPKGSVVIIDEAYHHFSNDESCIDLVAQDKDVIVMRTFSKIYGMAGSARGLCDCETGSDRAIQTVVGPSRSLASISITSAAAARASLQDKDLVPLRKKINTDIRSETLEFLTKKGYKIVPGSQGNMFMVDVKRPGKEFQTGHAEGERCHWTYLVRDAELRARHGRHEGRDGEVPDGLCEVHGHAAGSCEWRGCAAYAGVPCARRNCIEGSDALRDRKAPARDCRGFFLVVWGCGGDMAAKSTIADAVNLNSLWN